MVRNESSTELIQLLDNREEAIRLNAVLAMEKLGVEEGSTKLFELLKRDSSPEVRIAALNTLATLKDPLIEKAIEQALSDKEKIVRVRGLALIGQLEMSKELTAKLLAEVIQKRSKEEKQVAVLTLGAMPSEYSEDIFNKLLNRLEKGDLEPEIHLELAEAIDSTSSGPLKKRFEEISKNLSSEELFSSYEASLFGGNEEVGRRIFFQHQTAQCMKCHSFDDFGGNA
ncbi:HEAT repeat domain-containing protein [Antarcticibacterium sp. 1MA-6-2]|uniref:HEAT repeat domain-containing protein n=1 Tax=Antarcticibacterium sp. 1MA-6-2 TaxID=2908210 RepID=UPI001F2F06B4|nr:HEAT repeat domain-containing protein [Antarcticibacterium sp. 1MA-6-2]UJH90424.1 HEAT repeat domain-containing protein [Antarcticibacterium sp. 1MA-6-2]